MWPMRQIVYYIANVYYCLTFNIHLSSVLCNNFVTFFLQCSALSCLSDIILLLAVFTFNNFRAVSRRAAARRGRSYAYEEEKPDSAARASACGGRRIVRRA